MTASSLSWGPDLRVFQRDNAWLNEHLQSIWERHFPDTPRANPVDIAFAKRWKARLGLITLCEESHTSKIRLNSLLSHPAVPECIATITVAHELVHYAHGFGSTLPRCHRYPHQGGIVEKELIARGLGDTYEEYMEWLDENWDHFYHTQTEPQRHLSLPRQSGAVMRVGRASQTLQEAASVLHSRTAAEAASGRENLELP